MWVSADITNVKGMGKAPLGIWLGHTSFQIWGDIFKVKVHLATCKCTSKHLLIGDSLFFWELLSLSQLGGLLSFLSLGSLLGEPPYKYWFRTLLDEKKHGKENIRN